MSSTCTRRSLNFDAEQRQRPAEAAPPDALAAAHGPDETVTSGVPPVPAVPGEATPAPGTAAEPDAGRAHEFSGEAVGAVETPEAPRDTAPEALPREPPPAPAHPPSIEQRIGQHWLLYVGVAAVVLGASYLVKYVFDNEWITPLMRVVLGLVGGSALVFAGDRVARRDVALFGQGVAGGGLGILYLSLYAGLHLYGVLDPSTAWFGMVAATGLGTWMATRHASQALAVIAAVGAYATPYLIATETRSPAPLLSYLTVLAGGTWWLVRSHEWPALAIVSFVATLTTLAGWLFVSYRDTQYLVVEAYLIVLAAVFLRIAFDLHRRATVTAARATSVGALCALGAFLLGVIGPVCVHMASLAILVPHTLALLIYFIAVTLAGLLLAGDGDRPWIRVVAWAAIVPPFMGWLDTHSQARGALVTLLAIYGLHLIAELRALWHDRTRLRLPDGALLHANALALLIGLLTIVDSPNRADMVFVALGLAAWHVALAGMVRPRHDFAPWHYVALAAAFVATAIALRFDGPVIAIGWAIEGALVVWLGLRQRLAWMRWGGWVLFVVALADAIVVYGSGPSADMTPFANMHAAAFFIIAGLLLWLASRYRAARDAFERAPSQTLATCSVVACVLVLATLTEEVNGLFGARAWAAQVNEGAMAAGSVDFARLATISVLWAAYALGLVLIGILKRYRPIRYLAIAIFAATILKVFFVDLAELDTLYRILSVMGLGVLLLGASYLYQHFLRDADDEPAGDTR